ncbi:uncharacterized protein [Eucyclogobius newberryi]|uniref:uncharacterized protein n=1 Tax=Eucyclogobius newberryi TaxID=166745 RepID=UPI003B5A4AA6
MSGAVASSEASPLHICRRLYSTGEARVKWGMREGRTPNKQPESGPKPTTLRGSRVFYQVKPSGGRKVLKMVPGKSIQTQTMVPSSVHVRTPATQSRASPRGPSVPPLTPPPSHGPSEVHVQPLVLPCSTSPMKPTQSTSISLGTYFIQGPDLVQPCAKIPFKKKVLAIPSNKCDHPQIVAKLPADNLSPSPAQAPVSPSPAQAPVSPSPAQAPVSPSPATAIRTFTKVLNTAAPEITLNSQTHKLILRLPHKPNSPNKWVVEDNCANSTSSNSTFSNSMSSSQTPPPANNVLDVVAQREQSNKKSAVAQAWKGMEAQPECSVVMWNEKMFFRVEKTEPKPEAAELIDLCDDELCKAGNKTHTQSHDEDLVSFVGYFPARSGSRAEAGAEEKPQPAPGGRSSSTQPASSRERSTQRGAHTQMSSAPAPCAVADHKLKQMFGITSEVEIRLPRVGRSLQECQAPPLDYTQPIEEDFLCEAELPHSQDCPQVEVTSSRVGRTRKRTKCPCCSPAALLRHHAHKRRSKPGDRRETVRKQLRLTTVLTVPKTDPLATTVTVQKLLELMPTLPTNPYTSTPTSTPPARGSAPSNTPETTTTTIPMTTPVTGHRQVQLEPVTLTTPLTIASLAAPLTIAPLTTPLTTAPLTSPLTTVPLTSAPLTSPLTNAPVTTAPLTTAPLTIAPLTSPLTTTPLTTAPLTSPLTTTPLTTAPLSTAPLSIAPLTFPLTAPLTLQTTRPDVDDEVQQIHREMELLREALRLKEAALETLKSHRGTAL